MTAVLFATLCAPLFAFLPSWTGGEVLSPMESSVFSYELIIKKASTPGYSAYLGCFRMTDDWKDSYAVKPPRSFWQYNSVDVCVTHCWNDRIRFALLKETKLCQCTNVLQGLTLTANDTECNSPCTANRKQICGGVDRYSIYYTGYVDEPSYRKYTKEDYEKYYVGCYSHTEDMHLCPFSFSTIRMRAMMCMTVCGENMYLYATLIDETPKKCCCTNELNLKDKNLHAASNLCQLLCGDSNPNARELCGGEWGYRAVYKTGLAEKVKDYKRPEFKQIWMKPNINPKDVRYLP